MAFDVDENGRVLDASGNPLTADPRRNAYNSGLIVGADGNVYDLPTLLRNSGDAGSGGAGSGDAGGGDAGGGDAGGGDAGGA